MIAAPAWAGAGHGRWGLARQARIGYVAAPAWTVPTAPVLTYSVAPVHASSVAAAPVLLQIPQTVPQAVGAQLTYTLPPPPTVHYLAVLPGLAASTPGLTPDPIRAATPGGLTLEADADAILLRSDPQYLLLSARLGGPAQVRALKNEVRVQLLRELNRRGGTTAGIPWMRLLFRVARTFFLNTYGSDIPTDLVSLIERLIRDVLREEGIDAQPVSPNPSPDQARPFDGDGHSQDSATGRRFRIRGTIELLGDEAPNPPRGNPDDDTPALPPSPLNPADQDTQDQDQPAPPPRR